MKAEGSCAAGNTINRQVFTVRGEAAGVKDWV